MTTVSLGEVIKKGWTIYAYQIATVLLALALVFCLFKNGEVNWQLKQTNLQLDKRTASLIAEEARSATLRNAIDSQNLYIKKLNDTGEQMHKAGEDAKAKATARENSLQWEIDSLRKDKDRQCDVNGLGTRITQRIQSP